MDKASQSTKLILFIRLRSIGAINIKSGKKIPSFQKRKKWYRCVFKLFYNRTR